MKTLLAAICGAMLFAGTVAAGAATMSSQAKAGTDVPVTANVAPSHAGGVLPWNVDLAHQHGGGR